MIAVNFNTLNPPKSRFKRIRSEHRGSGIPFDAHMRGTDALIAEPRRRHEGNRFGSTTY